jgi:putative exporter of polyketide antibiotics
MLLLTTMSFAFALTVAAMCPAAGAVVGATVGRALAVRPTLLRVIAVTTLADVIGLVLSLPALLFQDTSMDLELLVGSGLVFAVPAYFLLAIPGVVLGVAIARLQP